MKSTLSIFKYLYSHLPPFIPEDIAPRMGEMIGKLETQPEVLLVEIEDAMIKFGYEVWPYNQAYKEILAATEEKLGEHFLLPAMSEGLKEKYLEFKNYGGTLKDLHSGRPAGFFTVEQRAELCNKLLEMQTKLRDYATRDILSVNQKEYLSRVEAYKKILKEIQENIHALRSLADKEDDHPMLADEMRAKVKDFEYSLCLLGPDLRYEAVCQAHEFFIGRKADLNRMRGINVPAQIDFLNS